MRLIICRPFFVDMRARNAKLRRRAEMMVSEIVPCSEREAAHHLVKAIERRERLRTGDARVVNPAQERCALTWPTSSSREEDNLVGCCLQFRNALLRYAEFRIVHEV